MLVEFMALAPGLLGVCIACIIAVIYFENRMNTECAQIGLLVDAQNRLGVAFASASLVQWYNRQRLLCVP
jgi:hypothetical protein